MQGVHQHHKGLPQLLQFPDDPLLRLQIVAAGNVRDAAVGGDHDAHGGVVADDLPGPQLRRLRHGDLMVIPRGHDHPGRQILELPHGTGNHVPHAVDEPHGEGGAVRQTHLCGLLRYELWLGGHNGAAGAALGQLVSGPLPSVVVFNIGQHLRLHKPFDEGGFSCADRPHHADIDAAAGTGCHILIHGCGTIHMLLLRILSAFAPSICGGTAH